MTAQINKVFLVTLLASFFLLVLGSGVASAQTPTYYYYVPTSSVAPQQQQFRFQPQFQPQFQNQFQNQFSGQNQLQLIQQLLNQIAQLQAQLNAIREGSNIRFTTTSGSGSFVGNSEIDITTNSATDIESDEVRLRGSVDFNSSDEAFVWFEWGEDDDDLDEETPRIRRDDSDDEDFGIRITDLDRDTKYYFRAVGEDEDGRIDKGSIRNFTTDDRRSSRDDDEPDPQTDNADNVDENSAELNGDVDMNDFNNGRVFFVWGEDEDQIRDVEDDYDTYNEVDEDGDDLQKTLVDSDLDDDDNYSEDVFGLNDDTEYFFSICVEFEDDDDDDVVVCGGVEDFETDRNGGGSSSDDEPDVETDPAEDVDEDSAEFSGEVDMNDFDNGRVFFVYGEDEDQVRDIEDDYDTYSDIDEDGDDLQKILVDTGFDDQGTFFADVFGLNDDTEHFFNLCVEFEDEDNDDKIICGSVEDFETDRD